MAYKHGIATSAVDLWNILIAFLTNNPDLAATGEQWSIVWTAPSGQQKDGIVLKGPGAGGADQILVGINRVDAVAADEQSINIRGMTAIVGTAATIDGHVNVSGTVGAFLDAGNMEYWMIANGRRFVLVAKMSTVYSALYGGFFLPYANPISYPYPLMIGGSHNPGWNTTNTPKPRNWRSQSSLHSHFPYSDWNRESGFGPDNTRATCYYLTVSAQWLAATKSEESPAQSAPYTFDSFDQNGEQDKWPVENSTAARNANMPRTSEMFARIEENVGGGFALNQLTIMTSQPIVETVGVLDGVYNVPGQNNAVENIVQIDGTDYLVIQNVFRTDVRQYWAMRLN